MITTPAIVNNYFNVTKVDDSNTRSEPPYSGGPFGDVIAYGGLLVSQAVNSFMTLHPGFFPHTVNYKFVAPVKTNVPLQFTVNNFDNGNIASVIVHQNGNHVGIGHVRHSNVIDLLDSSPFECPNFGSHNNYPNIVEVAKTKRISTPMENMSKLPLEIKPVESPLYRSNAKDRASYWVRIKPEFKDAVSDTEGIAILLFISDFFILQVAAGIYRKSKIMISSGASLHHSVWIHEEKLDPLGWYLTVTECEVISFGRVRLESRIFNEDRKCVMTVIQEAYMQRVRERENKL